VFPAHGSWECMANWQDEMQVVKETHVKGALKADGKGWTREEEKTAATSRHRYRLSISDNETEVQGGQMWGVKPAKGRKKATVGSTRGRG